MALPDPSTCPSELSSPVTPWSDAHSTFAGSPYLDASRAGSSTSLWTASSASSIVMDDEDVSSELRCLELLAELEREKRRRSLEEKRVHALKRAERDEPSHAHHARDDSLPDVQPLDLDKARAARNARYPNEPKSCTPSVTHSVSAPERLSRRASFTTTDLAELDIDAILDAYTSEALAAPSVHASASALGATGLPRSTQSYNLRGQTQMPPQSELPSLPAASLQRNSTAYSVRSTRSSRSNGSTATKVDKRAGPFPTITRQRSNGSLASRKLPFDAATAPPMPSTSPAIPLATSVPMANRTFSSFSRQSTASTASSCASSAHSVPIRSFPASSSPRMSCASSTMSRQTSSGSTHNSFRWSVATSSTVPTLVSDGGSSDCGASRRGSLAPSSVGSFRQSPTRSRRRPSAPFPGSPNEEEEDDRLWGQREVEADSLAGDADDDDDDDDDEKDGGLISWEDFADELANLPVPSRPNPRRMNSTHSNRSRNGSSASSSPPSFRSPFPSAARQQTSASNMVFASPESLRSTATLTSFSASSSTAAAAPKASSSASSSPTHVRTGGAKRGLLHGLRGKKSTRDLVAAFA